MALPATTHWRVRAGGNALNAGGFDPAPGDGTDYTDSDTPILSFTDLATTGAVTTVTTAAGGVTAAMKNNYVRLASGTNAIPGYYKIESVTDANTFVLDRTPASGAMSGGVGRIGGAFATPWGNLSNGGTVTAPTIATPLAAGHTVWIRGGGTDDPGSADYVQTGYAAYPSGNLTAGRIAFKGYNGRPRIDTNGLAVFGGASYATFQGLMFVVAGSTFPTDGMLTLGTQGRCVDLRIDVAGYDRVGIVAAEVIGCEFRNSGSSSAGTNAAIVSAGHLSVVGCQIVGWRGSAISRPAYAASPAEVRDSIVAFCRGAAAAVSVYSYDDGSSRYGARISNCTIHGNAGDGILLGSNGVAGNKLANYAGSSVINNVITDNGGYGINSDTSSALALNDRIAMLMDHNAFRGNASGARNALSAGANDITLSADPFVDAAGGDFTLNAAAGGGALIRDVAFPASFPSE